MTDPVGPTMNEIASDGSPLPPPISSTFCPVPIHASSTRPIFNGANICAISTRYLSQYRAEVCHASSALLCSSGIILVRRKLPRRKYQPNGCAATHLALNGGRSAVEFDNRLHQSQTEASAIEIG